VNCFWTYWNGRTEERKQHKYSISNKVIFIDFYFIKLLTIGTVLSKWFLICPFVVRLAFNDERLLLLISWFTVTRMTCWWFEFVVVDWTGVSMGNVGKRVAWVIVSVDKWRETFSGDVRAREFEFELTLLIKDENDIQISVLGKRSVHLR